MDLRFFNRKKIFITGHTGFKGAWLCQILLDAGAELTGYSLSPVSPSLFAISGLEKEMTSVFRDIRDANKLMDTFTAFRPEIVFHLAAQPLVLDSYARPAYTYETNVMGTVNILECVRLTDSVKSFVNVTTDKVYKNNEWLWGYRENEPLDGFDPYSNSKSCSELVTGTYKNAFFADGKIAVSTARAGNVIGGGDFAADRIIPDCVRAALKGDAVNVRNPNSIRPYQHVLDPLFAYLMIAKGQYENPELAGSYNVGPDNKDCITTRELVKLFCQHWGNGQTWEENAVLPHGLLGVRTHHEANFLKLDCTKLKTVFSWEPVWDIDRAVKETVNWTKIYSEKDDILKEMRREIKDFSADTPTGLI
jgi:CDP-glucose 4,6-dehydratase